MTNLGFKLYMAFVVSWFLRLPARVPVLGTIRMDLVLVVILTLLALVKRADSNPNKRSFIDKAIKVLIVYSVLTIPLVEWPGSVIKSGLPNLVKAVVFYYFTVAFIRTDKNLKRFTFVFIACQIFRVLEPLYLNVTENYWGSAASMGGGYEFMLRLSGSPYDVVNPNGLAFVIGIVLPFLYFMREISWRYWLFFALLTPALLYALALTGSRTGFIALIVIFLAIVVKSKRRVLLLMSGIIIALAGFAALSPDMQDRYLSTFGHGVKNAATAEERFEAMEGQWRVAMRRPLFGHGLGTSKEANYHFNDIGPYAGLAIPAHNIFLELGQEIGFLGLIIFVVLAMAIIKSFLVRQGGHTSREADPFILAFVSSMQVWIAMNVIFSFASYGLSSYDWYLFAGFNEVLRRRANGKQNPQ